MKIRAFNLFIIIGIIALAAYIQLGRAVFRITAPLDFGIAVALFLTTAVFVKYGVIRIPFLTYAMTVWVTVMFFIAMYVSPVIVGHKAKLLRVGYEAVCLLCMILYMITAYSIAAVNRELLLLRSISYFCLLNASLAVVSELTRYAPFMKRFYLSGAGIRFQGLAENPNDYMVQALVAVVYFYYSKKEGKALRIVSLIVLVFSAIAAGSKGGVFAIAMFMFIAYYEKFAGKVKEGAQKTILRILLPGVLIIALVLVIAFRNQIADILTFLKVKGVDRIIDLLRNPMGELNGGGSDRMITWGGTLKVFRLSPLIGAGIGGHGQILKYLRFEYYYETPHSIYFELLEQCGIIGFVIIAVCVCKFLIRYRAKEETDKIVKGAFAILLLDGIFFAADWSPTFWIIVGIMVMRANSRSSVIRLHKPGLNCIREYNRRICEDN